MPRKKKWIQGTIHEPGRVRNYIRNKYGAKAFNKDGTISMRYLNMAIIWVENGAPQRNRNHILDALLEARNLKKISKRRKKKKR